MPNDMEEALRLFNLLNDRTRTMLIEIINVEDTSNQQSEPECGDNRHLPNNGVMSHGDGLN